MDTPEMFFLIFLSFVQFFQLLVKTVSLYNKISCQSCCGKLEMTRSFVKEEVERDESEAKSQCIVELDNSKTGGLTRRK